VNRGQGVQERFLHIAGVRVLVTLPAVYLLALTLRQRRLQGLPETVPGSAAAAQHLAAEELQRVLQVPVLDLHEIPGPVSSPAIPTGGALAGHESYRKQVFAGPAAVLEVRAAAALVGVRGVAAVVYRVGGEAGARRDAPGALIVGFGYLVEVAFGEFPGVIFARDAIAGGWVHWLRYTLLRQGSVLLGRPRGVSAPSGRFYVWALVEPSDRIISGALVGRNSWCHNCCVGQ
jgi:hypothetical protein